MGTKVCKKNENVEDISIDVLQEKEENIFKKGYQEALNFKNQQNNVHNV